MTKIPRSFIRQASTTARLQTQPQIDALKYILESAATTRSQDIHNARNGARFLIRAAAQARPGLIEGYKRLGLPIEGALQQYTQDVGHVASAADQPSGAIRDEARIAADNLGLSAQAALSMLAQTQTRAAAEGNYRVNKAQAAYDQTAQQVGQRYSDLQSQYGQIKAKTLTDLLGEQTKRKFTAKQNQLGRDATHANAQTTSDDKYLTKYGMTKAEFMALPPAKRQALTAKKGSSKGAGTLPGGAKPLPTSMQNTIVNNIKTLVPMIKDQVGKPIPQDIVLPDGTKVPKGTKLTSHMARQLLTTKNNPLGKAFSHDEINAAFDVAVNGGLSRANVKALHKAGVRIKGRLPIIVPGAQGLEKSASVFGVGLATS